MKDKFEGIKHLILTNPLLTANKVGFDEIRFISEKIEKLFDDLQISVKTKKIAYLVAYELLQNIFRHGIQNTNINFVISQNSEDIYVLAENLIYTDEIKEVKKELDKINCSILNE